MRPIMQTKRGGPDVPPEERGDCLQACIASILEVSIGDVVIPHDDDLHWWDATQAACSAHGHVMVVASTSIWPDTHWIAGVPSQNLGSYADGAPVMHVIVMQGGQVAHDPCLGKRYAVGTPIDDLDVHDAYVLVPVETRSIAA